MQSIFSKLWAIKRFLICWFSPLVWSPLLLIGTQESKCGYVVLIMITYWFTEVVPMAITSLIPVILFPLFEIVSSEEIAKSYFNGTIMVFLGSLIAATAVAKSHLHQRIALKVILLTGTSPKRLLMGFMATTAFLSMWISNLATVALMIPIVDAALEQLNRRRSFNESSIFVVVDGGKSSRPNSLIKGASSMKNKSVNHALNQKEAKRLRKGILLGICYASNIGGTGTLTGTSTNLVLNGFLKDKPISFADWFFFNLPGLVILLIVTWLFLSLFFISQKTIKMANKQNEQRIYDALNLQCKQLGSLSFHEFAVFLLFTMLLTLWLFRAPDFMNGWTTIFVDNAQYIKDSMPTMFVVLLFFLIPADPKNLKTSPMLLDWKTTQEKISWSVILLLGGGFAMAKGCERSGLSVVLGESLKILEYLPPVWITMFMCSISLLLTELISNTASITVLLPLIQQMTLNMNMNPLSVMLPVTVSCSYAFMLPFASGTNAIIFETGKMKNRDMLIPGFVIKIISVIILMLIVNTWGNVVFDLKKPINLPIQSNSSTVAIP